jgi:hypothetical protein
MGLIGGRGGDDVRDAFELRRGFAVAGSAFAATLRPRI